MYNFRVKGNLKQIADNLLWNEKIGNTKLYKEIKITFTDGSSTIYTFGE